MNGVGKDIINQAGVSRPDRGNTIIVEFFNDALSVGGCSIADNVALAGAIPVHSGAVVTGIDSKTCGSGAGDSCGEVDYVAVFALVVITAMGLHAHIVGGLRFEADKGISRRVFNRFKQDISEICIGSELHNPSVGFAVFGPGDGGVVGGDAVGSHGQACGCRA